ncbi:MAG: phage terminase large subunit [Clostridia bacterium]|nr:phage terminase large subunit [Clostridia bacterium]
MVNSDNVVWSPQPKQAVFMSRGEDEALFGGAAGGGKSDAMIAEALRQIHIPHYKGIIFRKTYPELRELIDKSCLLYPKVKKGAHYNDSKHTWFFPNGVKIIFGDMHRPKDRFKYQGQAFDFIGFDELTHFEKVEYEYLKSRNRPNGPGTRCYIRATANPGGIGHGWVKERFVSPAPPLSTMWERAEINLPSGERQIGWSSRVFVPSTVFDNPALLANDPGYLTKLASLPKAEREALLYGNWDSFTGQYFSEWKNDPEHYLDRRWTHVIEPFDIPAHWKIYRSYDFGSAKPFSCGWWACDEEGILYRICELYGCTGTPNEGVKWPPDKQFKEIARVEREHPLLRGKQILGIADPSIWDSSRGESIAATAAKNKVIFTPGDNARIAGWAQVHNRMQFDEEGYTRIYFFTTCRSAIRTIPTLVHSETFVEDLDTTGEDHIADEVRYMCMARPVPALRRVANEARVMYDPLDMINKSRRRT